MSTCADLARLYATQTGDTIPGPTASTDEKNQWLLTQQWGCYDTSGTFHDATWCQANNDVPPAQTGSSTLGSRPAMINALDENGFLSWVNVRGMQCINRIVGRFYGTNPQTGLVNSPGPSVSPPPSRCWGACQNVTQSSSICFECVAQVLADEPNLCPDVSTAQDLQSAVTCQQCIGQQADLIAPQPSVSPAVDPTAVIDNMWECITGTVSGPWSTTLIVSIAMSGAFVLVVLLVLVLYFAYFRPKIRARLQLYSRGIDPGTL